jgi:cytoplasmic iron level regulating protein YaaA (DUF328/UPF0246 family)
VLILLPPSEGKSAPARGRPLDLGSLSFPVLHEPRTQALDALVELCSTGSPGTSPTPAADVLGLGATQTDEVERNARLRSAPASRADRIYRGVLYEALDLSSLEGAARRRATTRLAITSALFGLVRPSDHIPAYRLAGQVNLPGLGPVARHWGRHLGPAVDEAARGGLVVDLRSSAYTPFWRPSRDQASAVVRIRVLHEVGGRRAVVSHFNKATKGRLVRDLLLDGSAPRRPQRLLELLGDLGWEAETPDPSRPGDLDIVVTEL